MMLLLVEYIYPFFRQYHLEWGILSGILSWTLYTLCAQPDTKIHRISFVLLNTVFVLVLIPGVNYVPYVSLFPTQGSAIWYFFFLLILVTMVWSSVFLKENVPECFGYEIFILLFILLYKMVCSPLYEAETRMDPAVYCVCDLVCILILCILLCGLNVLFKRARLRLKVQVLQRLYIPLFYFPVSFFVFFLLYVSGNEVVCRYSFAIVGLLLLTNLPIWYYIFVMIIQAYHEKMELNAALERSKAELEGYRHLQEVEEQIRRERHELKNRYFYIRMLVQNEQYAELEAYLDKELGQELNSSLVIRTENVMLDRILNRKAEEAGKDRIRFETEIMVPERLPVDESIFCMILLNLLDNALEASRKEEEGMIQVTIKCVRGYLMCIVTNAVSGNVLETNPQLHTEKEDSEWHGLGLKIIGKAIREQNGLLQILSEKGRFTAKVMLPMEA